MTWARGFAVVAVWLVVFGVLAAIGLESWQSIVAVVVIGVASVIDGVVSR